MHGKDPTRSPELDCRVAKLASKYTLEYCAGVLDDDPDGVTKLLAWALNGVKLEDPEGLASQLMAGPHYHIRRNMKIEDVTPLHPVTLPKRLNPVMENPGLLVVDVESKSLSRADRNRNLAAITTDIAHQAGLILNKDYTLGDPFPAPSKLVTAKFLGDPIALTLQVIDALGYYTHTGAPRWSYMSIPIELWVTFTPAQRRQTVLSHYKREGGTAFLSLFGTSTMDVL